MPETCVARLITQRRQDEPATDLAPLTVGTGCSAVCSSLPPEGVGKVLSEGCGVAGQGLAGGGTSAGMALGVIMAVAPCRITCEGPCPPRRHHRPAGHRPPG